MSSINKNTKTNESSSKNDSDDLFDALIFRSTPGAPFSYDSDDDVSILLASRQNGPQNQPPSSPSSPSRTSTAGPVNSPNTPKALPPKVTVKVFVHEEVSSVQEQQSDLEDISSRVMVEGTVQAQVHSSDASKNLPIVVSVLDHDHPDETTFRWNDAVALPIETEEDPLSKEESCRIVAVPKSTLGRFTVASFSSAFQKRYMPVLVQSKVIRTGLNLERCMLAIQIRSNLNNTGNLVNLSLIVSVPPSIIASSLSFTRGKGTFDSLKRVLRWDISHLTRGASLMVGAQGDVVSSLYVDELPKFPILLRCSSEEDVIGGIEVSVDGTDNVPAAMIVKTYQSFRLLHRLP